MRVIAIGALATAAALAAWPAHAADKKKEQAAMFRALLQCRDLPDGDRLACYDRQTGLLASAEESGDVLIADRAQVREAQKGGFGFGGMRLPFAAADEEMPSQIEAKLTGLRDIGYGKWEFTLDNDMRWRQTDDDRIYPKVGDEIIVRQGAMGSFMLRAKNRAVRVIRTK